MRETERTREKERERERKTIRQRVNITTTGRSPCRTEPQRIL